MKKLFLTLSLVLMLVFAFAACDSGDNGGTTPGGDNTPHTHAYGEWETTKEPSCLEEGTKVRHCICLEQETETIPALGHTFDQKNVGDNYLKSEATEDSPALYYYSCKCGEKGVETFTVGNALGSSNGGDGAHVFRNEWTFDNEKHWRSCIDLSCDVRKNEANHTFGDWVIDEEPTCTENGTKHHSCVVCGKSVSETIPATNHNYSSAWATDNTSHWHECQNSGCTAVSDKTAHTFGEWIVEETATCVSTGTRHHICTTCNKSVNENYSDPSAHNYATSWTAIDNIYHGHKCQNSGCMAVSDKTAHTFGEWIVEETATCVSTGIRHHICTTCNKSVCENYSNPNAHNYAASWTNDDTYHWHICQISGCNAVSSKDVHNIVNEQCTTCDYTLPYTREGDYIYFGEYPQSLKADDVTVSYTRDSRGYYLGSDGAYYAKVTTGYYNVTYYKVEPIRWRIFSTSGNTALLLCDSIIANKSFDESKNGIYDNNYANSTIRAWLNNDFYTIAFDEAQKNFINTVLVDNSARSTSTGSSSNANACEDTNDKVFLLSRKEFAYNSNKMDASDYAKATGSTGMWWLRSPVSSSTEHAQIAPASSYAWQGYYVTASDVGVVPALQIRLK